MSPQAALARMELRGRYEQHGFASPLHALGPTEASKSLECLKRWEAHSKQVLDDYAPHEMNHAWLPWLRDLGRHAEIVSAVGEAFNTRNVCLYATELWALPPGQPSFAQATRWQTDAPDFAALLKPVDRRHFATVFLALTPCDARRGCLCVRPTAAGGKAGQEEVPLELRAGEFSLHGPSTKYALSRGRSGEALYAVVLRYVRATTSDPRADIFGREPVLVVSGNDEQRNFEAMVEHPGDFSAAGKDLRLAMLRRRLDKMMAGETMKGRESLKRPLIPPSSYLVQRTLEYGTTASIHLAKQASTQKGVVVKRVRDQASQRAIQRHFQEAQILERLRHPCVVQLIGVADTWETLDMVLEFCSEGCLTGYMQKGPGTHAAQLLCDLMCALAYLHGERLAHLDVKPDNLLVSAGRGKLCDFGTALHMPNSCVYRLTNVGTPGYRPPEIDSGMETDATKADVWSLGKVGEFVNQYAKGCWSCIEYATDRDPDERPPVKDCLEIYLELHESRRLIVT